MTTSLPTYTPLTDASYYSSAQGARLDHLAYLKGEFKPAWYWSGQEHESDGSYAWGQGFGTEATQLMLDLAFGTLDLHRIALYVFEFNERAIRAYRRAGFVIEGRSRESILRDGRWWDELAMSVLVTDWQAARDLNIYGR